MSSEINLLYSKKQLRRYKLTTQVRLIRFIALGILFLVTIVSMVFFFLVIASPLGGLKKQEAQLIQGLNQSQETIRQETLISLRMNDISTITQKRSNYDQILSSLISKLPQGVSLDDFSAEKKQATIIVSAASVTDLEKYISILGAFVGNKTYFSRVFLDSLSLDTSDPTNTNFKAQIVVLLL
ncbi:hypothetical protein BH09PAT1_BH09PAT1_7710 [soil metagenome]